MPDLSLFHFLRPWWLLALLPVCALGLWLVRRNASNTAWRNAVDPALLPYLLDQGGSSRHRSPAWLLSIGLLLLPLALAGPTWEQLPQPARQGLQPLVVVLDLSLSMYAGDVQPSRLERARYRIADILAQRGDGLTGLVVYAGDAHVVTPLTDDVRTINNLLPSLEPAIMPEFGSRARAGLELAEELLQRAGMDTGAVLLVTDGIDTLTDVTEALPGSIPVSVMGIGTAAGAPIPMDFANRPGEWFKDGQGLTVVPKLDQQRLALAADLAGGRYYSLDTNLAPLSRPNITGSNEQEQTILSYDSWLDRGPWLLLAALPLLLLSWRRGTLAVLAVTVAGTASMVPAPAQAMDWADLWQRPDQQAMAAIKEGQPDRAAALFQDPQWRASALHWAEEYQPAAELFGQAQTADGYYNQGTAKAKAGDLEGAKAAFQKALALDPQHSDAQFNLDLVERTEEQQQQQQAENEDAARQGEQGDGDQQQSLADQGQDEGERSEGEPEEGSQAQDAEQQEGQEQQAESEQDQNNTPPEDAYALDDSDEAQRQREQAMEQWLRRIPDDPGGLLRRKFRHETKLRYQSGRPRTQSDQEPW